MPFEIERKFLVTGDSFKQEAHKSERIAQGYLSSVAERTVRIRIKGAKGYITIKGISNETGTSRYEWEKEIPVKDAEELLKLCEPGVIEKIRHYIAYGNHTFEVDEFHGNNEGLILAEVELSDENEPYERPEWLGKEVTGDKLYYNSFLSKNPYCNWGDNRI
ncbi:MAG: CYTH domain-containing protein [Prevotella sp.]|jgi:adenylate cyclase|nr:CYTH domain-containing protein [Prevotella sp.]